MREFTQADKELFYVMNDRGGSFTTSLFQTIMRADKFNQEKLALGFPDEVQAVRDYRNTPDFWEELCKHMRG